MGMIANYQSINDVTFKRFSKIALQEDPDQLIAEIEVLQDQVEDDELLDIDKMWDAIHFLLTGNDTSEPIDGDPLSQSIVGKIVFSNTDFIAGIDKESVKEIAAALEQVDAEDLAREFDMQKCKDNEIYPKIWHLEDEADEILEEITDYFEALKVFYRKMADRNKNVLLTIY